MDDEVAAVLDLLKEGEARRTLAELGKRAALRAFDRVLAVRHAVALLEQRIERPVIRERLMERYSFSRRTAYSVIDEALALFCRPGSATVQFRRTPSQQTEDTITGDGPNNE